MMTDKSSPPGPQDFDSPLPEGIPWQPVLPDDTPLEVAIWQPDVDALNTVLYEPLITFPVPFEDEDGHSETPDNSR